MERDWKAHEGEEGSKRLDEGRRRPSVGYFLLSMRQSRITGDIYPRERERVQPIPGLDLSLNRSLRDEGSSVANQTASWSVTSALSFTFKKMCSIKEILLILVITSSCLAKPSSSKKSSDPSSCDPDKLMVYKVSLATHWSRTLFPKQYPEWRPPAQWSKLIGKFVIFIWRL